MATAGTKLNGDAKMLISLFCLFSSSKKMMSHKSRRGFRLMISFHKGLVTWGGLCRSSQEGTLKLLNLLKSPRTGKSNESRACLFKRQPIFPFMQSQERSGHPWASSGSTGVTLPQAAQLVVQAPPPVPFPNSKILTGFCSLG